MWVYFLKVNVAIALFYVFYRLFFYKDTFFSWRRTALLGFFAISAAVPLLDMQTWITAQEPMAAMAELYAGIVLPEFTLKPGTSLFDWESLITDYAGIVYWGGAVLLTARFFLRLTYVVCQGLRCRTLRINGYKIHLLPRPEAPFSFFHWIFIHPDSHTEEEFNEILTHERTHARQWHSIDVILSELACIACWCNPFVWLMKREIRSNLEYMADDRVLENGYDSKTYQYHLLKLSHPKAAATIYNSFNVLPLKKRIKMMNKKRTKEIGRTKYLMFLPLVALLLIISNIELVARTTKRIAAEVVRAADNEMKQPAAIEMSASIQQAKQEKKAARAKDSIPEDSVFAKVEVMPEFPDGGLRGLMRYFSKNLKYPEAAQAKGAQGNVYVAFVVAKDGSITHPRVVTGVDQDLDKEALRLISDMPKWKPGKQRGQAVNVQYSLPISFRLLKEKEEKKEKAYQPVGEQPSEIVAVARKSSTPPNEVNGDVFEVVEHMPEFPGGTKGLMEYVSKNLKYPAEAQKAGTQGRIILQIIIDKEGNVANPKIVQGADPLLDAEAIRLASAMPKWKPGTQKGQPVNVKYAFPIVFRL